ncbi:hypothetical protein TrRE_jg8652 [Triparma retinervis]|uniref:Pre-mRNA-splicing factor Syf1/CRNKL1-like C-terminal HAT-repeats domain-containing protein n=1 Tax=Triparma retinervis TaxID=2557542 RepID=A0A9W7ABQ9_9STRA|nr:hypothetical protein TrRE_jg8652 [Triparma retinervis]
MQKGARRKVEKKVAIASPKKSSSPSMPPSMPQLFDWRGGPSSGGWVDSPPPLPINVDLLTHKAKQDLRRNKLGEAEQGYRKCISLSPSDGRGYLGLSKVLQRKGKMLEARGALLDGLKTGGDDNVYLLHSLGSWEEKVGHLAEAEKLYLKGTKVAPSDAASWVSLAQLRTRKLGASISVGRICFASCEVEMQAAGKNNTYLYTAWGGMEWREKGDKELARHCFKKALEFDAKCSAAWLQLGCLESELGNYEVARDCFEECLDNEPKNSRVLQAYAILESKRGSSKRKAVDLFERALKANKRDAGALQAYALYVAELGDIEGARKLMKKGTEVAKRHAPVWQAWGVLETRFGSPGKAREVFQNGIWACAQSGGGQSGGRQCARLWQAWGVLEEQEGNVEDARKFYSRALDADRRNVPAVTAWALMEERIGEGKNARMIFERGLRHFSSPPSEAKMGLWNGYEQMELMAGQIIAADAVAERAARDKLVKIYNSNPPSIPPSKSESERGTSKRRKSKEEREMMRWEKKREATWGEGEVWIGDNGEFEGRMPKREQSQSSKEQKEMTEKE